MSKLLQFVFEGILIPSAILGSIVFFVVMLVSVMCAKKKKLPISKGKKLALGISAAVLVILGIIAVASIIATFVFFILTVSGILM